MVRESKTLQVGAFTSAICFGILYFSLLCMMRKSPGSSGRFNGFKRFDLSMQLRLMIKSYILQNYVEERLKSGMEIA